MGTPVSCCDCSLSSAELERTELMLGKCANRIRADPFQSIQSLGSRRISPAGRWRKRLPALSRFTHFPAIKSVRSIPGAQTHLTQCRCFSVVDPYLTSATAGPLAVWVRGVQH
jgi:hypothetical protein